MNRRKKLTAKEYLGQIELIDTNINQNIERLYELKMSMEGTSGIDYSKPSVQTSPAGDKLCSEIARYTALSEKIDAETDQFTEIKSQIIGEIRSLYKKEYIELLFKLYVQYKTLHEAAVETKMSYSYASTLHQKALAEFERKYPDLHYLI